MQNFLAILPALISLALLGLLILIGASISLTCDLRKMRQERQEGIFSVWYRRPIIRNSLKGIGIALMIILGTVWWGWSTFLPGDLSSLSKMGLVCAGGIVLLVLACTGLVHNLRTLQGKRQKGSLSVWYREPKILRRIGWVAFWCGFLSEAGYIEYVQLESYFLHHSSLRSTLPGLVVACVFFSITLILYAYVAAIKAKEIYHELQKH